MNHEYLQSARVGRRAKRAIGAAIAALTLATGAAWHANTDAIASAGDAPATAVAPPVQRQVAAGRDSYADVVTVVAPAVVTIRTKSKAKISPTEFHDDDLLRRFFGDRSRRAHPPIPRTERGMGSGVIVSADGYILTNHHVVDEADEIRVETTDGRTFAAKIVGSDPPTDLALLKVEASSLKPLALGNSDAVNVGDVVLAVGNPLGVGQTVTMGIISAKGRSTLMGDGSYEDFLQTDAPINRGNSGGALVNLQGELVGINSQILSNSEGNIGIGFAIPANMARGVMEQLRAHGTVTRAQLGVTVQRVTEEMAESLGLKRTGGAIVASVAPGSAAERAGIRQGDVIDSFNGQPVQDFNSLRNRVAEAAPGSRAAVVILRDGEQKSLTVTLDEAKAAAAARGERGEAAGQADHAALGVSVAPLTPELANRLGLKTTKGVVIQEVNPDGRAADAGLQPGDVIHEVNRAAVDSIDDLRAAVKKSGDKPLLLLINREGASLFVTVSATNG